MADWTTARASSLPNQSAMASTTSREMSPPISHSWPSTAWRPERAARWARWRTGSVGLAGVTVKNRGSDIAVPPAQLRLTEADPVLDGVPVHGDGGGDPLGQRHRSVEGQPMRGPPFVAVFPPGLVTVPVVCLLVPRGPVDHPPTAWAAIHRDGE